MVVRPPIHTFVHKCCTELPLCECMGGHDPSYLDHTPYIEPHGVFEGAKPNFYRDPSLNVKTSVYYPLKEDNHYICYLGHHFYLHDNPPPAIVPNLDSDNDSSDSQMEAPQIPAVPSDNDTDMASNHDVDTALLLDDFDIE